MTARTYGNGAWRGELRLVLLQDKDHAATRAGRSLWAVESPLTYLSRFGESITLPPGMVTDLASIPRLAWGLLPPDGPWALAAVFHDRLYQTRGTCGALAPLGTPGRTRRAPYTRAEADGLLLEAMRALRVGRLKRRLIWAAVRLGGGAGWGH